MNSDDPLSREQLHAARLRTATWADAQWPGTWIPATALTEPMYRPSEQAVEATVEMLDALGIGVEQT